MSWGPHLRKWKQRIGLHRQFSEANPFMSSKGSELVLGAQRGSSVGNQRGTRPSPGRFQEFTPQKREGSPQCRSSSTAGALSSSEQLRTAFPSSLPDCAEPTIALPRCSELGRTARLSPVKTRRELQASYPTAASSFARLARSTARPMDAREAPALSEATPAARLMPPRMLLLSPRACLTAPCSRTCTPAN